MNTCEKCGFYDGKNKCRLPIGNPTSAIKSAREHYRHYFKCICPRDKEGKLTKDG